MTSEFPNVLAVPTEAEIPSLDLSLPAGDAGEVVVLLAHEEPRKDRWAARVAVALARQWSGEGLRVFLADGDLEDPSLHELVEQENGEGISDALMYGASPGRISRPVARDGFLFAPAGTVVPDPDQAYAHPRWEPLLSAFRESGSILLLYLPAGEGEGVASLVARADRVIRLTPEPPAAVPDGRDVVIHGMAVPASSSSGSPPPGPDEASRERSAESPEPAAEVAEPMFGLAGEEADEPPPAARARPAGGRPALWMSLVILVLLLVLGILAAAWLGYLTIPGIAFASGQVQLGASPAALSLPSLPG